jgi:hypothetical protein
MYFQVDPDTSEVVGRKNFMGLISTYQFIGIFTLGLTLSK